MKYSSHEGRIDSHFVLYCYSSKKALTSRVVSSGAGTWAQPARSEVKQQSTNILIWHITLSKPSYR